MQCLSQMTRGPKSWREPWCRSESCRTRWETASFSSAPSSRSCAATWTRRGRGSWCPTSRCTRRSSKPTTLFSPAWTRSTTRLTGDFVRCNWQLGKTLLSDNSAPNSTHWARCCQRWVNCREDKEWQMLIRNNKSCRCRCTSSCAPPSPPLPTSSSSSTWPTTSSTGSQLLWVWWCDYLNYFSIQLKGREIWVNLCSESDIWDKKTLNS